jgi:hypothetical protein
VRRAHQRPRGHGHKTTSTQVGKYTADNFIFLPASMLPFKEQWRRLAGEAVTGEAIFIVPRGETPLRKAMRRIVPQLRAGDASELGRPVLATCVKDSVKRARLTIKRRPARP